MLFAIMFTYFLFLFLLFLGLLLNDVHQAALQGLFVFRQPILLPGIIEDLWVKVVTLHAAFKESYARLVVWLLLKFEGSAVLHEGLELMGMAAAQVFEWRLNLLLLDCCILVVLASTGKTLPWQ